MTPGHYASHPESEAPKSFSRQFAETVGRMFGFTTYGGYAEYFGGLILLVAGVAIVVWNLKRS
jgi:putative Mn2+ efflux pump MntP